MVCPELHLGEAGLGLLQDLEMGLGVLLGVAYQVRLLGSKIHLKPHPGDKVNVTLHLNQKHCLRLQEHKALHHPQSSTTKVSPLREKEVGQNPQ